MPKRGAQQEQSRLRVDDQVKFRRETFGGLVFFAQNCQTFQVNACGVLVLELCNGERSREKILADLELCGTNTRGVDQYLETLLRLGIVREVD